MRVAIERDRRFRLIVISTVERVNLQLFISSFCATFLVHWLRAWTSVDLTAVAFEIQELAFTWTLSLLLGISLVDIIDRIVPMIVALVSIAGTSTNAQTTPRPSDQTKSFLLTEFSLGKQFGNYTLDGEKRSESEGVAAWELGYMRNVSERWALGIAVFLNAGDWRSQLGIKPRARYWLGKRSSIDFGAGPILKTICEDHLTHVGISSHVGINASQL